MSKQSLTKEWEMPKEFGRDGYEWLKIYILTDEIALSPEYWKEMSHKT